MSAVSVRRIETERGSHIEPPLDQSWSDLEKLRWHLAVTLHDAGLEPDAVRVEQGHLTVSGHRVWDAYDLRWSRGSFGAPSYSQMWSVINGISLGLKMREAA